MNEDVLKNLQSEFKLWGVRPTVNYLNSGHIELEWHATPDKPARRYIIPKTGSDWRGWLNARSKIRQLFKADGIKLQEQIKKEREKPALLKALAVPESIEKDSDQLKMLRAEVADLSELILSMMTMVKELIAVTPPEPVMVAAPVQMVPPAPKKPSTRSIKTIDYVSESWTSLDAIARDMNLEPTIVYRKLYYLLQQGKLELSDGRWRRKPKKIVDVAQLENLPKLRKKTASTGNGHHKH